MQGAQRVGEGHLLDVARLEDERLIVCTQRQQGGAQQCVGTMQVRRREHIVLGRRDEKATRALRMKHKRLTVIHRRKGARVWTVCPELS